MYAVENNIIIPTHLCVCTHANWLKVCNVVVYIPIHIEKYWSRGLLSVVPQTVTHSECQIARYSAIQNYKLPTLYILCNWTRTIMHGCIIIQYTNATFRLLHNYTWFYDIYYTGGGPHVT